MSTHQEIMEDFYKEIITRIRIARAGTVLIVDPEDYETGMVDKNPEITIKKKTKSK